MCVPWNNTSLWARVCLPPGWPYPSEGAELNSGSVSKAQPTTTVRCDAYLPTHVLMCRAHMLIFRMFGNLRKGRPLYYRIEIITRVSLLLCNFPGNLAFPKGCKVCHTDDRGRCGYTSTSKYQVHDRCMISSWVFAKVNKAKLGVARGKRGRTSTLCTSVDDTILTGKITALLFVSLSTLSTKTSSCSSSRPKTQATGHSNTHFAVSSAAD